MNAFAGRWLTLVLVVLTGAMLWASVGLSRVSGWIPQIVLTATLILLSWQAVRDWLAARGAAAEPAGPEPPARRAREWAAVGWIAALLLAAWGLGVVAGCTLFCLAWLRWHARERWPACLAFAAGLGLALWLIFALLLGAALHPGLLWRWLA